ncbi:GntR family transcriptional regulator [Petroclostridium sp. X23]|uniref:GntR family transcriptional regulator n=1 Tax=Petroclostridium sp. X23 TaxID=3045146 RepID=UPI0024AE51C5|nr:GntR family transcriptional regulator [Petroclostridium sp. X23]WHH57542.1 GntR family transcriptional regulator [Petroclostridium sp. X23]
MGKIQIDQDNENYSLRVKVFKELEEHILNGKFQPGDSLIETKLSDEFGVSRTPIREAIRQLELEGLVRTIPNKGAVVLGVSTKDIEDIYTIRMLIEGLAARWAAEKITDEEIEQLKESVELSEFYTIKNDMQHLQKLDSKFHEIIYEACKSKPLKHTLSTFHHYIKRARATSFETPGRAKKALEEHKAILQAIIDRDGERAQKLMYEHNKNASSNLIIRNKNDSKN